MIKKTISEKDLELFLNKYSKEIYKDSLDRVYMHCISPEHNDSNRSAVLYKDSGVFHCGSCGFKTHVSKCINKQVEYIPKKIIKKENKLPFFDLNRYPQRFFKMGDVLRMANIIDGKIVGIITRMNWNNRKGRIYKVDGKPGFNLDAKIITESYTDAIRLIEAGIYAGSIGSTTNINLLSGNQLYIGQSDIPGLKACREANKTGCWSLGWYNKFKGYKDINDLDNITFNEFIKEYNLK